MVVSSFHYKTESNLSAERCFRALSQCLDELYPSVQPQSISSIELIGGDGGPGTVKRLTFTQDEDLQVFIMIDTVDKEKLRYKFTVLKAASNAASNAASKMENIYAITYENHYEAVTPCTSMVTTTSKYYHKSGVEKEVKSLHQKLHGKGKKMLEDYERYLLENPDVCA